LCWRRAIGICLRPSPTAGGRPFQCRGRDGEKDGAFVELEKVPLKYAGLRHDEIWISEAQERMVLSVPPAKVWALLDLAGSEDVEATVDRAFWNRRARTGA